jgi:hypothetical protein
MLYLYLIDIIIVLREWNEKQYTIQAPIPKDLRATLQQLEKWCTQ